MEDTSRAFENRVLEATRFGLFVPNTPEYEVRSGGTTFGGAREMARNAIRVAWKVVSLTFKLSAIDEN